MLRPNRLDDVICNKHNFRGSSCPLCQRDYIRERTIRECQQALSALLNNEQEVQGPRRNEDATTTEAGNQNPSQLKEATILSAEEVLKKYCKGFAKCDKDYDDHEFEEYWKELKKDENMFSLTLAAMEEYKNQVNK